MRKVAAVCLTALAALLASASAGAQDGGLSGMWQTHSGSVGNRGGGNIVMKAVHRNGGVSLSYGDNTMVCALNGQRCGGNWQGKTGSGWFAITFSSDGRNFAGTWGYGNDRSNVGTFSGNR